MNTASLLPPRFLFRFELPCLYHDPLWSDRGVQLPDTHRLLGLSELDGRREGADVRAAWNETGLAFTVRAEGKRQQPWCRESRIDDSDGLQVWIDTRNTAGVHRAVRFCHRFVFLPAGGGRSLAEPVADQMLVDRARENAEPVRPGALKVRSEKRVDGYLLEAFIPAAALTGFDPLEYSKLGFTYCVYDREFGEQTLGVGSELPYGADPSLWTTLDLVRE
jgi:hypothetical protein